MNKQATLLSLFFIISINFYGQGGAALLDQKVLYGTLQIKYKNSTATAFQYKGIDSVGYLITAKHTFATKYRRTIKNGSAVTYQFYDSVDIVDGGKVDVKIFYKGGWADMDARLFYDRNKADVAILKTNIPMEGNSYSLEVGGFVISQECFFIGYPLGLRMDFSKQEGFSPYTIPFVRKGIFSAIGGIFDGVILKYYIDGHNTYGFSGGPLLYYSSIRNSFVVTGVISGYIPQRNRLLKEDGTEQFSEENSGLMEVVNIEFAKRILMRLKCM